MVETHAVSRRASSSRLHGLSGRDTSTECFAKDKASVAYLAVSRLIEIPWLSSPIAY